MSVGRQGNGRGPAAEQPDGARPTDAGRPGTSPLDRRPEDYFSLPPGPALVNAILGTRRREVALEHLLDGRLQELDPRLLRPALDGEIREAWTSTHPSFHAGEGLPPPEPDEVEIARVVYAGARGEALSLRARPADGGGIRYRLVDELERDYATRPAQSERPLTLRELLALLGDSGRADRPDAPGLLGEARLARLEAGDRLDAALGHARVRSLFYPEAEDVLAERRDDWLAAQERHWAHEGALGGHALDVPDLAIGEEARLLLCAMGSRILLWDLEEQRAAGLVDTGDEQLGCFAASADGETLLSGGSGPARLWDLAAGEARGALDEGASFARVTALALSPEGGLVAVGGSGATVARPGDVEPAARPILSLYALQDRRPLAELGAAGLAATPRGLALLPADELLLAVDGETLLLWDLAKGEARTRLALPAEALALSPRGAWCAVAGEGGATVVDLASATPIARIPARIAAGEPAPLALAQDGRTAALRDGEGVAIWDLVEGRRRQWLGQDEGLPLSLAFSEDGLTLACGRSGGAVSLWRLRAGPEPDAQPGARPETRPEA